MISKYNDSKFKTEKLLNEPLLNHDFKCVALILSESSETIITSDVLTFPMNDFLKMRIFGEIEVLIAYG